MFLDYSYDIDIEDINLNDYKFLEYPTDTNRITYIKPTELKYSTITSNVSLLPIIQNLEIEIEKLNKIIEKYPLIKENITYDILYFIYIHRIIIDCINPEEFFKTLNTSLMKKKKTLKYLSEKLFKITTSNFININLIYDNIILDNDTVTSVFMRNKEIKTIDNYVNKKSGFRNQISFRMKSEDKKRIINIMIFQNGKMTLSGCRNENDIIYISSFIKNFIENFKVNEICAVNYKLKTEKIIYHSINCHFNLNFKINNNEIYKLFKDNELVDFISYKPNTFPGLKIRFKEDIKMNFKGGLVIFFQSGKINLYRSAHFEEIEWLYKTINEIIYKNYNLIIVY